jgi:A/G-specific adenine glycosylase
VKRLLGFQRFILRWYHQHGRHELPWRQTTNPYHILVSEIMLQQTQVERVVPKYNAFIKTFPTVESLARATLSHVLAQWQGLGYNRRAKFLQLTAQAVLEKHNGSFPKALTKLLALPGVGLYTAAAIRTFAYNQPEPLIETNVRTVFLYHFFPNRKQVSDAEILTLISRSLYVTNPKEWYAALMDYGSVLKKLLPNPSRKSKHYTKQSRFAGSLRQVRGEILKILLKNGSLTKSELSQQITGNKLHLPAALDQLMHDGLVQLHGQRYAILEKEHQL